MKLKLTTILMAGAMVMAAPVLAQDSTEAAAGWNQGGGEQDEALGLTPDHENGIYTYEVCSACHQLNGWGLDDGTFPQLAGQHVDVIIKQLADIRAQNRDNPTMYPFALPQEIGGAQSIMDVATYISNLPMNPQNGVGPGTDLERGEALYKENCVRCHGENGEGSNEKFYPRIHGQHHNYLVRQFQWIRDGKRRNANPDMVKQIAGFSDADMNAVLDYVSRLDPPAEMVADDPNWSNPDFDW
ncbi:MAG TPA: c-type cytochrome [Aliiroseovarius sp.]|nr:c-type cytochrome [Aliiroseovarius sp.]